MSISRVLMSLAALAAIALVVVHLRAEQARCAARIMRLESRRSELRQQRWALQARAARLRTPQRLHDRIESLQTDLLPPGPEDAIRPPARLASDRL